MVVLSAPSRGGSKGMPNPGYDTVAGRIVGACSIVLELDESMSTVKSL